MSVRGCVVNELSWLERWMPARTVVFCERDCIVCSYIHYVSFFFLSSFLYCVGVLWVFFFFLLCLLGCSLAFYD